MSWTNGVTLKDINFDGWLNAVGSVAPPYTGGAYESIRYGYVTDPMGGLDTGVAGYNPGYNPVGKYLIGVYFELLTNPSGDGYGRGAANIASNSVGIVGIGLNHYISVVGDMILLINQCYTVPVEASHAIQITLVRNPNDGNAGYTATGHTATFRFCALFRDTMYPVK
jgi:hypothetical protein